MSDGVTPGEFTRLSTMFEKLGIPPKEASHAILSTPRAILFVLEALVGQLPVPNNRASNAGPKPQPKPRP